VLAALVVLLAAAPAWAGDSPLQPSFEIVGPNRVKALRIVTAANAAVVGRDPECRTQDPRPATSDAAVPSEFAAALGVLRRPQTPEETTFERPARFGGTVLRASVRTIRTLPDGLRLRVFVAEMPYGMRARPAACRTSIVSEIRARSRDEPGPVRRAALRMQDRSVREELKLVTLPPTIPFAFVQASHPDGSFAGLGSLSARELDGPVSLSLAERDGGLLFIGLAPDGVARVELTLPAGRATTRSSAVVDNVVAIPLVPDGIEIAGWRARWLARDGTEIARSRQR
jgi:hypothetical protein